MSSWTTRIHDIIQGLDTLTTATALQQYKAQHLGKKSALTLALQELKHLSPEEKRRQGTELHAARAALESAIAEKAQQLEEQTLQNALSAEAVDLTKPARRLHSLGSLHPMTQLMRRIETYWIGLGFELTTGPLVEHEAINFTALNTPAHHPARAESDTFYLSKTYLLRTQTSTVQIHGMRARQAPMRLISMGPVFRSDSSVRHTPMFHQLEGVIIDKELHLGQLKTLLEGFLAWFFHQDQVKTRFRTSYFPFTEPSAELDMVCHVCQGKGCRVCSQTGWIEMLGCGMMHPSVLKAGHIEYPTYVGAAFGLGLERLAMLYYGLEDIRLLYENDIRFLAPFANYDR